MCKRNGVMVTLLFIFIFSIFLNTYYFSDLYKQISTTNHQLGHTQLDVEVADRNFKKFSDYVVNYYDRKPDFHRLAKANVVLKMGLFYSSGTVIGIEKDYTYVLTAKHCTTQKKRANLEIEIPMQDREYDSGKGKKYLIGCEYVTINEKDIYVDETYDIALFRFPTIEGHELDFLPPAKQSCHIGDTVYAVGNPLAITDNITKGIFSSVETFEEEKYMVVSSGVIFGNSGGAVVNDNGEIAGVFSAVLYYDSPKQRIYVFHLGMCVPQHIVNEFVLRAYENLTK